MSLLMLKSIIMLSFRKACIKDMQMYFDWANDLEVRKQSYNSSPIDIATHRKWFESAIINDSYDMYVFFDDDSKNVGQIRIQKLKNREALIGISIDSKHRGKKYAYEMLILSTEAFFKLNKEFQINAYIKESNLNSKFSFEKAGFKFSEMVNYEGYNSFHYKKVKNEDK